MAILKGLSANEPSHFATVTHAQLLIANDAASEDVLLIHAPNQESRNSVTFATCAGAAVGRETVRYRQMDSRRLSVPRSRPSTSSKVDQEESPGEGNSARLLLIAKPNSLLSLVCT